jgi:hypothetical protein
VLASGLNQGRKLDAAMAHGQSASLARRLDTTRRRARLAAETAERRVAIALGSAGIGFLERNETLPIEVAGIPVKLGLGIIATLVEANSSGAMRRITGAIADASFAIYGYQAVKTRSLIAGVGEDVGEDVGELVGDEL